MLAGPGDRRDEDLRAIAQAVAGRFDHYICRRDDNLRDRGPDEVPRIMAAALLAAGVPQSAISVIPDEQAAIDAALRMGRPGRPAAGLRRRAGALLEADHLLPAGRRRRRRRRRSPAGAGPVVEAPVESAAPLSLEGLIRDERGIRYAPEASD